MGLSTDLCVLIVTEIHKINPRYSLGDKDPRTSPYTECWIGLF